MANALNLSSVEMGKEWGWGVGEGPCVIVFKKCSGFYFYFLLKGEGNAIQNLDTVMYYKIFN